MESKHLKQFLIARKKWYYIRKWLMLNSTFLIIKIIENNIIICIQIRDKYEIMLKWTSIIIGQGSYSRRSYVVTFGWYFTLRSKPPEQGHGFLLSPQDQISKIHNSEYCIFSRVDTLTSLTPIPYPSKLKHKVHKGKNLVCVV